MNDFSIGEAGVSGLRLIARRPLAVMAWGLTYMVFYGLPLIGFIMVLLPSIAAIAAHPGSPPSPGDPAFMAMISRMQLMRLPMMIGPIVARALVYSAVFRAVLEPEASAFGYLRFSMKEFWVGAVALVGSILLAVAIFAAVLVLAIPVGVVAVIERGAIRPETWALVAFAGGALLLGVMVWLVLRFSLALPMSFAQGEFRLFESWSATRGRAWALLGTSLIAVVLVWLLEMVVLGVVMTAVLLAVFHGHWDAQAMTRLVQAGPATWAPRLLPWAIGFSVVLSLLVGAASAIIMAPFATVYRAIAPGLGAELA